MKPSSFAAAVLALLGLAACLASADPIDFTRPEAPRKPAPRGLKFIDQGGSDPRLKGYKTPEGIKVEIVAEEPVVVNPVGLTFATDGTPYVLEWVHGEGKEVAETFTYKDGSTRKVLTVKKSVPDVVKVLRDSKGKGVYDEARVVLKDALPSSILLHDGWLYLSGRGSVRRYRQSKPGGEYDVKEVIAQGFGGFGRHQVSGLTLGPDGWLYVTAGDNDNHVEGSDGSRATVLRSGAVFRCRPDGSKMQTFAIGFCNPYRDVAFDAVGNLFHADSDGEAGGKFSGCRLMHVAEGCDFGWRLRSGARCCTPDLVRAAVFGELPGKVPPLAKTGRGAPAGLLIYNDTRLPDLYRGALYYPDPVRKLVRAYRVEPDGGTFAVSEEFDFLHSDDPLFHPCQTVVGPDGAIYVVDSRTVWPGLTGSGGDKPPVAPGGDGKQGRIYRITWAGTKETEALPRRGMDSWDRVVKLGDAELLKALESDEASDRAVAQRELVRRGKKNVAELIKIVKNEDAPEQAQVAALGCLQSFWDAEVEKVFEQVLATGTRDQRRLAAEGLGRNGTPGDRLQASLLGALGTEDPALKRALVLAMGRLAAPGAADALVNTLAFDDGKDAYLRDGLIRAIEALGKPGLERLLALADSGVAKDLDRVVDAFTAFRTRAAAEALPALLRNPHLGIEQRATLVASYNNYLLDPPLSLDPLLNYLAANPQEAELVKRAAVVVLGTTVEGARLAGKMILDDKLPRTLQAQVSEALGRHGVVLDYQVVGPFGDDLKKEDAPEARPEPKATYPGPKPGSVLRWQPATAEAAGLLNLGAVFPAGRHSAYALNYVHSRQAQKVPMLVGSHDGVRIWLNGKVVHEHARARPGQPDEDRVMVELREGWNVVLAKVGNVEKGHGLYLRFVGEGLRIARTSEAK